MADDALYHSGLDPEVNTFDLGTDPLAYAERQLKLGRELWQITETRDAQGRRELRAPAPQLHARPLRGAAQRLQAAKYVGGLTLHSDRAGTGRAPLEPIPPAKQRAALKLLATEFRRRELPVLAVVPAPPRDHDQDIDDARVLGRSVPTVDVASTSRCSTCSARCSRRSWRPEIAQRLLNNELKVDGSRGGAAARRAVRHAARRDLQRGRHRRATSRSSGATCSANT